MIDLPSRRPVLFATILLGGMAVWAPLKQLRADNALPMPRDLQPGLRAEAGPYARPEGCPLHDWQVGEYLPTSCVEGEVVQGSRLAADGLEAPQNVYWRGRHGHRRPNFVERYWVRAGSAALLVSAPPYASGKILQVVRDRFPETDPFVAAAYGSDDGQDRRRPPADYVTGARTGLWTEAWLYMTMLLIAWVWGLAKLVIRRRPEDELATEDHG